MNYAKKTLSRPKPEIEWKTVRRRIREIRGFDTNQAEFACRLGVSQGQLSEYELRARNK